MHTGVAVCVYSQRREAKIECFVIKLYKIAIHPFMRNENTKCLLDRLEQLNADVPEGLTGLMKYFGYTNKKPPVQQQKLDKSKFINLMTVEEMAEIEDTKTKITACLKELEAMQAQAFEKQKEITKVCYDVFSKYRGLVDVRSVRVMWLGMHSIPQGQRRVYDLSEAEKKKMEARDEYTPKEWEVKCKVKGEPGDAWDKYVDEQWDAAYEHAFGVTAFGEFIKTGVPKMMNLDLQSGKALDVDRTWYDLWEETSYFQQKITMHHISMSGRLYPFVQDSFEKLRIANQWAYPTNHKYNVYGFGLADPTSLDIVNAFENKTKELLALVDNLWRLRKSGWLQRWDRESGDNWTNHQRKYPTLHTQPNYVVPRPVISGTND
jgi:predicted SnoaL-like aldol condensation-catalyzing enzyme